MSTNNQPPVDRQAPSVANDQFVWLRQVAFDHGLPPAAEAVAIGLTKYFNYIEHDGWAWMSQKTLGLDLGMGESTVRHTLKAMVDGGHLLARRRGKMESNLYHLALKQGADSQPEEASDRQATDDHDRQATDDQPRVTVQSERSDRPNLTKVTGKLRTPNSIKEPKEEPKERIDSLSLDLGDEDRRRRSEHHDDIDHEFESDFEEFWNQYPRKVAKAMAFRTYRAVLIKKQATPAKLLSGARCYAAERSGQEQRYTKHPATWLNGKCWLDEPAAPIGNTIDQHGNPVASAPPPNRRPPPYQRESNFERTLRKLQERGEL